MTFLIMPGSMRSGLCSRHLRVVLAVLVAIVTFWLTPSGAHAQELEPRAYSNSPVGFNFLIAGYVFSEGGLSVDPSLLVQDAELKIHSGIFAYARTLDLWGKSGKFDVILPYSRLTGSATVAGEFRERDVSGFGEPRVRMSVNLYGAPALSLQEFATYKRDLVIGASLQASGPAGQYDSTRAINLGSNRWMVKPDIGFSKSLGPITLDFTTSVTFYSDNDDYFGGKTFEQEPVYAAQTNFSSDFGGGVWAALGVTYYRGGQTTVNGDSNENELGNARAGAILVLPVNRHQSVKLSANNGVHTPVGSDFTIFGIAWQYRWGAGY